MKRRMLGSVAAGAVGAAVAAAMVVTVYEGKVVASNRHGEVEVTAGERSELRSDAAPGHPTARFAEAEQLAATDDTATASATHLRYRVRELESQLADARADMRADSSAVEGDDDDGDDDPWQNELFEPTQAHLLRAAEECRVQWATPTPSVHGNVRTLDDKTVARVGLSPKERAAVDALADPLPRPRLAVVVRPRGREETHCPGEARREVGEAGQGRSDPHDQERAIEFAAGGELGDSGHRDEDEAEGESRGVDDSGCPA